MSDRSTDHTDRLFVPLKTEHYRDFDAGEKEWELRGINNQFNEDTVREGRQVELRRGYSTDDSLWGTITDVAVFGMLSEIPAEIDHRKINPTVSHTEFLDHAAQLLGEYERYIAFRVDVGRQAVTDGGTDVDDTDRSGAVASGFKVRGMEPQRNIYDFEISIDAEFAGELRALDVPDNQEGATEHIEGALTHDMADVRFVGDSFLLRGITVGFQATGLDLHKEDRGRQRFATHNVDSPGEAIEVISAFSRWESLATHLVEDRREDDGLRADGGTVEDGTERTVIIEISVPRVLQNQPNRIVEGAMKRDMEIGLPWDSEPDVRCEDTGTEGSR